MQLFGCSWFFALCNDIYFTEVVLWIIVLRIVALLVLMALVLRLIIVVLIVLIVGYMLVVLTASFRTIAIYLGHCRPFGKPKM